MTKTEFLDLPAEAYAFPDYFGHNLDAADEILADKRETEEERIDLRPFFEILLQEADEEERVACIGLLEGHFLPLLTDAGEKD